MPVHEKNQSTEEQVCTAYTYQSATVSVPVAVRPQVKLGTIDTYCCGEPQITPSPYKIVCKPGGCDFVLTQNICVEVPIHFSADAFQGCPKTMCGEVTTEMCEDCGG